MSEASFKKVVQLLSKRRSHEVDFFNLNGFESGMKGLLKWHIQPGKKRTVVVNFFISGDFSFSFVSTSLAYITIPKSKRKKKLPEIKNLLQQDFYKVYIVISAPLFCSKVLEDEEEAALEKEDQEREKEVLACNMLLLTCNYRGAAGKV